jgi:hypothetical protein
MEPISSPSQNRELIYQDPKRRTRIWTTSPAAQVRDADDEMTHEQIQATEVVPKTNRIRVSLGNINIEIESNEGSPVMQFTPRMHSSPLVKYSPQTSTTNPRRETGMSSRRAMGREIPSTPGSSPVHLKSESTTRDHVEREESMVDDVGGFGSELDLGGEHEPMAVDQEPQGGQEEGEEMDKEYTEPEEENVEDTDMAGLGIDNIGPDTQQALEDQPFEDLTIPDIELPPSPEKQSTKPKTNPSKISTFLDNLDEWVAQKAMKYDIDEDIVHYVLERTSCRPKLTVKVIRHIKNSSDRTGNSSVLHTNAELPDMRGVWTEKEDQELGRTTDARVLERLDEKHGYGAAAVRKEFLQNWNRSAMRLADTKWKH